MSEHLSSHITCAELICSIYIVLIVIMWCEICHTAHLESCLWEGHVLQRYWSGTVDKLCVMFAVPVEFDPSPPSWSTHSIINKRLLYWLLPLGRMYCFFRSTKNEVCVLHSSEDTFYSFTWSISNPRCYLSHDKSVLNGPLNLYHGKTSFSVTLLFV